MTGLSFSVYTNEDLAVVSKEKRTWNTWNYAALWISMSLCIPTYMLASSLIDGGMNWWQAMLTVFLGNLIVLVPMVFNGHAGTHYGIPFPVLARSSFGILGANIPALLRAIVACGWFGIQTWIGGASLYQVLRIWFPTIENLPHIFPVWLGLETGPALTFLAFLLLNMFVVHKGIESIRKLLLFKAVFLPAAAISLLMWAVISAKGFGPILSQPSKFHSVPDFLKFFFPALTAMVGFWATLSLNIPDFTRYAKSQKAQMVGQAIGLAPSMTLFAFIGIAVTSATQIVYGTPIWDPIALSARFKSPVIVSFAMVSVIISTLATNIAANIVSPANDFSNLWPSKINFRIGGYMTGVIGAVILPWKLIASPSGYIFTWLIAYSSLLGPIAGIMIADYFLIRKKKLLIDDLYRKEGCYWYQGGFNPKALGALLAGIVPNIPGFLVTIQLIEKTSVPAWMADIYHYAWFVGFAISFLVYLALSRRKLIEKFDSLGAKYEDSFKIFLKHTDQKIKAQEWLNRFASHLKARNTFIDVGAGTGIVTAWLMDQFKRTIAIEPNPTLFADLKHECPHAELLPKQIFDVRLDPIGDLVLCSHVLYYLDVSKWKDTILRLSSWISKEGAAVIILQNPNTDCMNMLKHFYHRAFDLPTVINQLGPLSSELYKTKLETVDSFIETHDLESAYRIAEFVLNLIPSDHPPSEALLKEYVQEHFKKPGGKFRFSCHQDFVTITRKSLPPSSSTE